MPSIIKNGAGTTSYDWSNSHVHLYKMHRGMTTAVIQDICVSQYSQWAAIVSSGELAIFLLYLLLGVTLIFKQSSHSDGPILLPGVSSPWWSTSSFMPCESQSTEGSCLHSDSEISRSYQGLS